MMISVIVPVYNVEKYLRKCLNSLLKQTYKNLEIVVIDDGSTDSSGSICDEYAEKYDSFFVIHKENAGLGMARNTGLEYITGEYVVFLDADDYIEPTFIEVLYRNLINYKVDMCKGGFLRVTDHKEIVSIRKFNNEIFEGKKAREELLPRMIGSSPSRHDSIEMCVWGAIYNASIIKKYDLKFPSERKLISEDLVFNIDFMQHADGACTISETEYNYRINPESLSMSYRIDRFEASRYFYLEMKKKLAGYGYDKTIILRLDRMFFIYLRMCIAQEKKRSSKKTGKKSIRKIREICNDSIVRQAIKEYPVERLDFKQKLFLKMISLKMAKSLYILAGLEIM